MIFEFLLHLIHWTRFLLSLIYSTFIRQPEPLPLLAPRDKLPRHLALILVSQDEDGKEEENVSEGLAQAMMESVRRTIDWCNATGIESLTVYDRQGIVSSQWKADVDSKLKLHFASRASSKPNLANVARSLAMSHLRSGTSTPESDVRSRTPVKHTYKQFSLTMSELNELVEVHGTDSFKEPDLALVFQPSPNGLPSATRELHGFPPWQIRLTEIAGIPSEPWRPWRSQKYRILEETHFRQALDEYGGAQMRLGK